MSWRRLGGLIRALPRESATRRSVLGDSNEWGHTEHLLATLIDVVQGWSWVQLGDKKVPRPKPVSRPGEVKPNRTQLSATEIAERLRSQLRRG